MTSQEFIDLTRRMRKAQKLYYSLNPKTDTIRKTEALVAAKQLESQVDKAEIEDPANLETDFPRGETHLIDG